MLIIPVIETNLELLTALYGEEIPDLKERLRKNTYLLMDPPNPPRFIDEKELYRLTSQGHRPTIV